MAKRQPHMSAAPAYIVYGHRHAVRLVTRLVAIALADRRDRHGLLRHRLATRLREPARGRAAGCPRRQCGHAADRASRRARGRRRPRRALSWAPRSPPSSRRRAKPQDAQAGQADPAARARCPVMVLNSNGISGAAHRLASHRAELRLPDHATSATRSGAACRPSCSTPRATARRRASSRRRARQRAVRDAVRRHHAHAGRQGASSSSSSAPELSRSGAGVARSRSRPRRVSGEDVVVA